jgi:hypothetical protein
MSWVSASDSQILKGNQQVKVHFAQSCVTNPSFDQIAQAIVAAGGAGGGGSVSSVESVSTDITATISNPLSLLTIFYIAIINPIEGTQAGQLRADVYNALAVAAQNSGINCNSFAVSTIEYDDGSSALSTAVCGAGGCGVGGKSLLGLGLIAWIAAIGLIFLVLLKSA